MSTRWNYVAQTSPRACHVCWSKGVAGEKLGYRRQIWTLGIMHFRPPIWRGCEIKIAGDLIECSSLQARTYMQVFMDQGMSSFTGRAAQTRRETGSFENVLPYSTTSVVTGWQWQFSSSDAVWAKIVLDWEYTSPKKSRKLVGVSNLGVER
jgi:hypothetical protein